MTAAELRKKRQHILIQYGVTYDEMTETLDALDLLDAQSRIPRPPFYVFVERHEAQWKLFLASQGETGSAKAHQRAVIDVLIDGLIEYAETLKTGETV
jgi:hypothetical protein